VGLPALRGLAVSLLRRRRPRPRPRLVGVVTLTDWRAVTDALLARCDGLCESCGLPLPTRWDRHHRRARSAVSGDDSLPNLVALHHDCHVNAPWAVHMRPTWAKAQGLIVPSWQLPGSASLCLPDGRLVYLSQEGPYHVIAEGDW
jgi:hypothetical protein